MGDVYVAEDTRLNRRVAVKFLRPEVAEARDSRGRILRKPERAAALNHPNIVHLYRSKKPTILSSSRWSSFRVRACASFWKRHGPPLAAETHLLRHSDGRRPDVCSRCGNPAPRLEARQRHDYRRRAGQDSRLRRWRRSSARSQPGPGRLDDDGKMTPASARRGWHGRLHVAGTGPRRALDARTDLFALWAWSLFEMATGRTPFQGDTVAAVFDHLLNRRPPSPADFNPTLPQSLSDHHRQSAREGPRSAISVGGRVPAGI